MRMGDWGVLSVCSGALGGQRTSVGFSGAGVTATLSHWMWVPGTRPRFSVRAASVFNLLAISTAPLPGSQQYFLSLPWSTWSENYFI